MLAAERPPVATVVQLHADEAAHLRLMRSVLVRAPHVGLLHLRRLDERIAAHLDGLMESGAAGRALCREALAEPKAGELFTATVTCLQAGETAALESLLALAASLPAAQSGLLSAFGWVPATSLRGVTKALLDSPDPFRRGVGLAACAMHQVDPGAPLKAALTADDPALRTRALRVAAACGRIDLLPQCLSLLNGAGCGLDAARAALLLGDREASVQALQAQAAAKTPGRIEALQLVLKVLAPPDAHKLLKSLAQDPADLPVLISSVGAAGDTHYAAWLLKHMDDPAVARSAGAAFSLITGVDIVKAGLEGEAPDAPPGPNDDPDDANVELDTEEGLPWPDARKVERWWQAEGHRFPPGERRFMGENVSPPQALHVLTEGSQRQRAAAADYMVLMKPGTLRFNVAAPAWRQDRALARMRGEA